MSVREEAYIEELESELDKLGNAMTNLEREHNELQKENDELRSLINSTRDGVLEEAAKVALHRLGRSYDCERLGITDPETGVAECSLDVRGGDCLCNERAEEDYEIAKAIRALQSPHGADKAEGEKPTTEQLDVAQFGRVLHQRPTTLSPQGVQAAALAHANAYRKRMGFFTPVDLDKVYDDPGVIEDMRAAITAYEAGR